MNKLSLLKLYYASSDRNTADACQLIDHYASSDILFDENRLPDGGPPILRYPGYLNRGIVNKLILADVLSLSIFDIIVARRACLFGI